MAKDKDPTLTVIISANAEWDAVKLSFAGARIKQSPYGEYFKTEVGDCAALFFHGGWGKVAAAGSTQYVVDHFKLEYINLGTCGGIDGRVNRFDIVGVERVVIYDIHEAIGDSPEAIAHYTTELNVPHELPSSIIRTTMYSADRDLTPGYLRELERRYRRRVVDWESGALAWVAKKNGIPLLILRGVTDLVGPDAAEAEGNLTLYAENTRQVMRSLICDLPKYCAAMVTNMGRCVTSGNSSG